MKAGLYQLLAARAQGRCECGCSRSLGDFGEADHFLGRKHAAETEFLVWIIHRSCHHEKTNNRPSAAHLIGLFVLHCRRYAVGENGYVVAIAEAEKKRAWLEARKGVLP